MQRFRPFVLCGLAALLVGSRAADAQVRQTSGTREARLSGECQSIAGSARQTISMGDARVRRGGFVRTTGVRQSIYIEDGAEADIQGTGSTVYIARGGKATIGGIRNQVVAEHGGDMSIVGNATVTIVDGLDLRLHPNALACR